VDRIFLPDVPGLGGWTGVRRSFPLDLLNSFFFGMGLAGLWGYLSDSRIGWRPFWVGYFCLTIALVIYGIGFLMFDPNVRAWPEIWFFVAAATLVTAPHWVALWRYAFRSSQVWSRGNVA
jgi:hypothetical protein